MSKIEKSKGKSMENSLTRKRKSESRRQSSLIIAICLLPIVFLSAACRQDMHDNPRYEAYEDGAGRQMPEGTVARGSLDLSPSAPKVTVQTAAGGQTAPAVTAAAGQPAATPAAIPTGEDGFPFRLSDNAEERKTQLKEILDRGENRFNISCLPCHGKLGDGNGMIVQRGFRRPPSYHQERLQKAPSSYFYDVMTNGFGAMPSYTDQLTPEDRWKVVAYIRALQLSQRATLTELGEVVKKDVEAKIGEAASRKTQGQPAQTSGGHSN